MPPLSSRLAALQGRQFTSGGDSSQGAAPPLPGQQPGYNPWATMPAQAAPTPQDQGYALPGQPNQLPTYGGSTNYGAAFGDVPSAAPAVGSGQPALGQPGNPTAYQAQGRGAPTGPAIPVNAGQGGGGAGNAAVNLGNLSLDPQVPQNWIARQRGNMAANAAAQTVFNIDPATGQVLGPKSSYKLDPTSAQYDPNQWAANNALMQAAGTNYMQGQANKTTMPGEQDYRNALGQNQNAVQQVYTAAQGVRGSDAVSRNAQQQQLGQYGQDLGLLRATAQGTGPSAAQGMLQQATDRNIRSQMQMAAGARGGNVANAYRAATAAGADQAQQQASQMSTLRAQEQLQGQAQLAGAQSQLAGAMQGMRSQDQGAAMNNVVAAAQAQQAAQAQVNAQQGFTQTGQAQYAQGLQEQAMGLQYGNEGVRNQGNLMALRAQIAQAAASGDQSAMNAALQYYQLAQQGQLGWQGITTDAANTAYQRQQMQEAQKNAELQAGLQFVGGIPQMVSPFL